MKEGEPRLAELTDRMSKVVRYAEMLTGTDKTEEEMEYARKYRERAEALITEIKQMAHDAWLKIALYKVLRNSRIEP